MTEDELLKTIEENQKNCMEPHISEIFDVSDVDYLEVEILKLPIIDLNSRFITRICKPINMVIDTEIVRISWKTDMQAVENELKEEMLKKWKKMMGESGESISNIKDEKARKLMEKWHNISEVKIYEVELTRKK